MHGVPVAHPHANMEAHMRPYAVNVPCFTATAFAGERAGRNPHALQLHRLLLQGLGEAASSSSGGSGDEPGSASGGESDSDDLWEGTTGTASELPPQLSRMISLQDMESFSEEGYSLVGLVPLADTFPQAGSPKVSQQQAKSTRVGAATAALSNTGATDDSGSTQYVRALRITKDGLLFAAIYDMEALSQQLSGGSSSEGTSSHAAGTGSSSGDELEGEQPALLVGEST
jgi:hypothetical protein